jgi:hypothetical protein
MYCGFRASHRRAQQQLMLGWRPHAHCHMPPHHTHAHTHTHTHMHTSIHTRVIIQHTSAAFTACQRQHAAVRRCKPYACLAALSLAADAMALSRAASAAAEPNASQSSPAEAVCTPTHRRSSVDTHVNHNISAGQACTAQPSRRCRHRREHSAQRTAHRAQSTHARTVPTQNSKMHHVILPMAAIYRFAGQAHAYCPPPFLPDGDLSQQHRAAES